MIKQSVFHHILNTARSGMQDIGAFEVWQINPFDTGEINHQIFLKDIIRNFVIWIKNRISNSRGTKFENTIFEMLFHALTILLIIEGKSILCLSRAVGPY
jgi:hypothetical protein